MKYIYGDLTDFKFCKKITKNIDFLFHVAGIKGSIVVKKKPSIIFCSFADDEYKYFRGQEELIKLKDFVHQFNWSLLTIKIFMKIKIVLINSQWICFLVGQKNG